jgi:hypothetical protein
VKKWWHVLIALTILGVLLTFLHFDLKHEDQKEAEEEKKSLVIPASFSWDELAEVEITTQKTAVSFIPSDKKPGGPENWEWAITKPLKTETDSSDVQNYIRTLKELKIKSTIEETITDLQPFGLDAKKNQPLRVKLTTVKGATELLIGDLNPDKSSNYAVFSGASANKILLIEQKLNYLQPKELAYFRNKTVVNFDNANVRRIVYKWDKQEAIELEMESANKWKMLKPFVAQGDALKISSFLGDVKNARIDNYPSENADADTVKFGFNKPLGTMEFELIKPEKKVISLTIGGNNPTKAGFYVRKSDVPTVFELQNYHLEKFKKPLEHFVEHRLGETIAGEVDAIKIHQGVIPGAGKDAEEKDLLLEQHEQGLWKLKMDGKTVPANTDKMQLLVRKLRELNGKTYLSRQPSKEQGLDKPALEVVLNPSKTPSFRYAFGAVRSKDPKINKNVPESLKPLLYYAQGGVDNFVFDLEPLSFTTINDAVAQLRETHPIYRNINFTDFTLQIGSDPKRFVKATKSNAGWKQLDSKGDPLMAGTNLDKVVDALNSLEVEQFPSNPKLIYAAPDSKRDLTLVFSFNKTVEGNAKGATLHPDLELHIAAHPLSNGYMMEAKSSGAFDPYVAVLKKGNVDALMQLLNLPKEPQPDKKAK